MRGNEEVKGIGPNKAQEIPLEYRLRKHVKMHETPDSILLILDYPLKTVTLNPVWKSIIRLLDRGEFIGFGDLPPLGKKASSESMEIFLNGLVRKGFLESRGFLTLKEYPYVSVIIPVRNRPDDIAACLESLERLDYPIYKKEIIVVDDASNDGTIETISKFPVQLIRLKERHHAPFCRNLAAREAKGEILAFLDSDCVADPQWLKETVPVFNDLSNGAAGGLVDALFHENGLDRYEKAKSSLNMGAWSKSSKEGDRFFYVPSCNLLVRKDLFFELGGFREDIVVGEDVDLCWRIQDQGHHIEYRPIGKVHHKHRNALKPFCFRRFVYGTSEPFLQKTHPERVKQLVLPLSSIFFFAPVGLSILSGWILWLVLSGTVILIDTMIRGKRIHEEQIPVTYARIFLAVFRSHFTIVYHWCAFFSRYYLFFAILLAIPTPLISIIICCMHLLTASTEFYIKKPKLFFPGFFFYFSLDQIFYQAGVWWGCIKRHYFNPVNPRVVRKPL